MEGRHPARVLGQHRNPNLRLQGRAGTKPFRSATDPLRGYFPAPFWTRGPEVSTGMSGQTTVQSCRQGPMRGCVLPLRRTTSAHRAGSRQRADPTLRQGPRPARWSRWLAAADAGQHCHRCTRCLGNPRRVQPVNLHPTSPTAPALASGVRPTRARARLPRCPGQLRLSTARSWR